jgi:hypothetical protein
VVAVGNKRRYAWRPVGIDERMPHSMHPSQGAQVVLSDQAPDWGLPKGNRKARHIRYVEDADTGKFHGAVLKSSLIPVTKRNPTGDPYEADSARAASLINDRRSNNS